jgi:uncharacterized protein YjlB
VKRDMNVNQRIQLPRNIIRGEARLFKVGGQGTVRVEGVWGEGVPLPAGKGHDPFPQYVEFRRCRL